MDKDKDKDKDEDKDEDRTSMPVCEGGGSNLN